MFAKYKWYFIGAAVVIAGIVIYMKFGKKGNGQTVTANAGADDQNTLLSPEQLRQQSLKNDLAGALSN